MFIFTLEASSVFNLSMLGRLTMNYVLKEVNRSEWYGDIGRNQASYERNDWREGVYHREPWPKEALELVGYPGRDL